MPEALIVIPPIAASLVMATLYLTGRQNCRYFNIEFLDQMRRLGDHLVQSCAQVNNAFFITVHLWVLAATGWVIFITLIALHITIRIPKWYFEFWNFIGEMLGLWAKCKTSSFRAPQHAAARKVLVDLFLYLPKTIIKLSIM